MEIVWLGGNVNEQIAAQLKSRGYIDDFEANAAYTVLIINRDRVEIPTVELINAIEMATGKQYPHFELMRIISSMFANIRGGKLDEFSPQKIVLVAKESKRVLSIRIPESLYRKVNERAKQEGKTITKVVVEALEKHLS
ncbi:MAG: hypothetical protein DRJ60_00140 [Thermoprotei archaeon]|nr:MAG: hypothetical protein DRJ60_00140 [Thermoprotei archaeon]